MSSNTTPSVIHNAYNHPLIITEGELTPKLIMEFEQACQTFFDNAKGGVPDDQKVVWILPAFKDTLNVIGLLPAGTNSQLSHLKLS